MQPSQLMNPARSSMQIFSDLISNATLQAWIWGPIMGVIFGAIFAGLTTAPAVNAPVTVTQTTQKFVVNNVVIHKRGPQTSKDSSGAGALFLALGVGVIFLIWKYVMFIELVHYVLGLLLCTVLSFSLTIALVSLIKGQFTSGTWAIYIACPLLILASCGGLLRLAKVSLDPNLTQLAAQHTFLEFYMQALSAFGRSLVICQMIGMAIISLVMACTALALLHYLALMNQRSYGVLQKFWMGLTRMTIFCSGKAWLFLLMTGLVVAFLLIEPRAAPTWMTPR
jgi:hypothetical protein